MDLNLCSTTTHLKNEAYMDVTKNFSDNSVATGSCHKVYAISVLLAQISITRGLSGRGYPNCLKEWM